MCASNVYVPCIHSCVCACDMCVLYVYFRYANRIEGTIYLLLDQDLREVQKETESQKETKDDKPVPLPGESVSKLCILLLW